MKWVQRTVVFEEKQAFDEKCAILMNKGWEIVHYQVLYRDRGSCLIYIAILKRWMDEEGD